MRTLFTFFFPLYLFCQQHHVKFIWEGVDLVQVGDSIKQIPKAIGHNIFYNEENQKYSINISREYSENEKLSFSIKNIQIQEIKSNKGLDINFNLIDSDPQFFIYQTKNRNKNQVVVEINPFMVKNNKLYAVKEFLIVSSKNYSSSELKSQKHISQDNFHPDYGYRFEVKRSGIHKITGKFLSEIGMPISKVKPETLKIFGKGGKMIPLINNDDNGVNYGFSENPLKLVGMEDGVIDEDDYILFYAYGLNEWNEDSQTSINLYQNKAHYIISFGGNSGLRVNTLSTLPPIENSLTSAFISVHFEQDLVNVAKMGRKWFGDRFLHNSNKSYGFSLTNRKPETPIDIKFSAAASSINSSRFDLSVDGSIVSLNLNSTQTLTKASEGIASMSVSPSANELEFLLHFDASGLSSSVGYLDYISLTYNRNLFSNNEQFGFKLNSSKIYKSSNADSIWEILSDGTINVYESNNNDIYFESSTSADRYHFYVANDEYLPERSYYGDIFSSPKIRTRLSNEAEYIIITRDDFVEEANRLAEHHRSNSGLKSVVLSLSEIYDDFNAGNVDIVAIRNAIRYAYINNSLDNKPKYVCLFGDTSYDYKDRVRNNNMIVPTYHALNSFNLANSYMSDDFFAMMDNGEGDLGYYDRMDLAVGRILFDSKLGSQEMVNKSINYSLSNGDWQNIFTILSDDPDENWENIIQERLDVLGEEVVNKRPFINLQKFHSDAYEQVVTASGNSYPSLKEAIDNQFTQGTLAINYFGHGGESGLASEKIFDIELARSLYNPAKLPLFITSTCEFSRFDNPEVYTAGEASYSNPLGGAIALISTTRQIYVTNGINYNEKIAKNLFAYGLDEYPTMSEALRLSKNEFSGTSQRRIIFFIGDPALKLSIPDGKLELTHINGSEINSLSNSHKQLKALDRVNLAGEVLDENGEIQYNFDGKVFLTIYDKELVKSTLGNDGNGTFSFKSLGNIVFKGNAEVINGYWNVELIIPKDISMPLGQARISMYAVSNDNKIKKTGFSNDLTIGGINSSPEIDTSGPDIELFFNNESFKNGDTVEKNPMLIAKFYDENGINTSSGLGHELIAVLDGSTQNPIILNNFYSTKVGDYKYGALNYLIKDLSPGPHTISVTAWDTYNNPSTQSIDFIVSSSNSVVINNIYNTPNPFKTKTTFFIYHNKPREPIEAVVVINDMNGKTVWKHRKKLYSGSSTNSELFWNGHTNDGTLVNKGLYLCTITLNSTLSNTSYTEIHKIIKN